MINLSIEIPIRFTYIISDFIPNYFQDMRDPLGTNTGNASICNEL